MHGAPPEKETAQRELGGAGGSLIKFRQPSDTTAALSSQARLHPIWTGGRDGYHYSVIFQGECIVSRSRDPETDTARALLAKGVIGKLTFLDGKTGKPRTVINIEKAAKLVTTEENRSGLRFRKPSRATDNSPSSPETGVVE